ncbi:hypothetical protein [Mitsuokella multacida]|uniref:hypothetical protein n=1 Tax=Mitsuokella multacida TaxID=52226 RepID=UPI00241EDEE6|nr:hypothetical protein [Mitsuokella multacida]
MEQNSVKFCPFMHKECIGESCMMYVREALVFDDLNTYGNEVIERKTFKTAHCSLNEKAADVRCEETKTQAEEQENPETNSPDDGVGNLEMMSIWNY